MSMPLRNSPVLQAHRVHKQFGPTVSLDNVSVDIHGGRILALLGDNGAGKSTLVKILCGVLQPDSGTLRMNGEPVLFRNPSHARRRGIATVFQDLAVCPMMSITRNVVLGNEPLKGPAPFRWFDAGRARAQTREALIGLGVRFGRGLDEPASTLSGGERQALAIARAIYFGSTCLMLDEPTSALAVRQAGKVMHHIRAARDRGQAVVLITHNFRHALEIADDFIVLGHGRVIGRFARDAVDLEKLIDLVSEENVNPI